MKTSKKVLQAAEELFFRHGIRSITMDDIAKHLGMSKKTIYQFFEDKDQIVHSLMKEKLKEDEENFCCIAENAANVVEEVFGYMKNMTEMFTHINPNLFYDLQKYYSASWKLFQSFKEEYIFKAVEKSIEKGKKDGHVRKEINSAILAKLRMQEIEMAFNPAIFSPEKFKILDVQLALTEHFLYGICTLKGYELITKYKKQASSIYEKN